MHRRSKFTVRQQHSQYPLSYGGELFKSRRGRKRGGRLLEPQHTLHLVLRSTLAVGAWSFSRTPNKRRVQELFDKFSARYGVHVYSVAYAGNHIHCQIRIQSRKLYRKFIRALTGAIAMAVTNTSRWRNNLKGLKFWSGRPFTRIARGRSAFTRVQDYIHINRLESRGYTRNQARFLIDQEKYPPWDPFPGSA